MLLINITVTLIDVLLNTGFICSFVYLCIIQEYQFLWLEVRGETLGKSYIS